MPDTRRTFLKRGVTTAVGLSAASMFTPQPVLAHAAVKSRATPPINDPQIKTLMLRGVDAARQAGARYADIRLTHEYFRIVKGGAGSRDSEAISVGVRALVDDYWGFAASSIWSGDEIARLGQEAAFLAKTNALGAGRVVDLASTPAVKDGHWTMPVRIDPFSLHPSHIYDVLEGVAISWKEGRYKFRVGTEWAADFFRQEKAFASTDGTYLTQTTYRTGGFFKLDYNGGRDIGGQASVDFLTPSGLGFEMFDEQRLRDSIDPLIESIERDSKLPIKPVDVGRFDTVLGVGAMASLLCDTIGIATEMDRAMGFEANADGTSYLNDPSTMIGSYALGTPALSVVANRSDPGAVATVQWDDEGVAPEPFSLIEDGKVVDFQTTRESASWLDDAYTQRRIGLKSHGCSHASAGVDAPMVRCANLVMTPGKESLGFDDLMKVVGEGIAFRGLNVSTDFQKLNGMAYGSGYEIHNGQPVARIKDVGILFRTPEFWKSLSAVGGAASAKRFGLDTGKGQPQQTAYASMTAVPCAFTKVAVIDIMRKA